MEGQIETTQVPDPDIERARDLLAHALDHQLPDEPALAVVAAYCHVDSASDDLWPPPGYAYISDPVEVLQTVVTLLSAALDRRANGLNQLSLAVAVREARTALQLLAEEGC